MVATRSREPQRSAESHKHPIAGDSAVRTHEPRSAAQPAGAACPPRRGQTFLYASPRVVEHTPHHHGLPSSERIFLVYFCPIAFQLFA